MTPNPPPPTPETLKETTEKLVSFAQWIVELIRRRSWFTLLLLGDVVWFFFGNPGVMGAVFKLLTNQDLPAGYVGIFWLVLVLIFGVALVTAIVTLPKPISLDVSAAGTRTAIKGLRAFARSIGQCVSPDCRVAVAAEAVQTWAEIQHPALATLKQQETDEDGNE
ncbi:MAG: hypothetical protein KME16_08000 [Scytolyngbya sp. HA4215-MV1]|jgi:hypothetical protein|nr:hypothetical protein [Scytolyngbya sp. HA4215-MV1]